MTAADVDRDRDAPRAIALLHVGGDRRPIRLTAVDRSTRCNLGLVDDLLRMQVLAARVGWMVEIADVCSELQELFELVGLTGQLETS